MELWDEFAADAEKMLQKESPPDPSGSYYSKAEVDKMLADQAKKITEELAKSMKQAAIDPEKDENEEPEEEENKNEEAGTEE